MRVSRFAMTTAILIACHTVQGATGTVTAPAAPRNAPPDCWVEHTQVQPSPLRQGSTGEKLADAKSRLLADEHVGAEHPSTARPRSCNALPPRAKGAARPVDGRR